MTMRGPRLGRFFDVTSAVAWLVGILFGVVVLYSLVTVTINASAVRAASDAIVAQEIDQENDAFCQKYGMAPRSDTYQSCKLDLIEIRHKQSERWAKEASFF